MCLSFCFSSTSSRLYRLCLSCRRRYIDSSSVYVLVHTRLLSLFSIPVARKPCVGGGSGLRSGHNRPYIGAVRDCSPFSCCLLLVFSLFRSLSRFCSLAVLCIYLHMAIPAAPRFIRFGCAAELTFALKTAAVALGCPPDFFSSKSWRIAAATLLRALGKDEEAIRAFRNWTSTASYIYQHNQGGEDRPLALS